MLNLEQTKQDEWLEADGFGGFASGTVSGIRTRRYHASLLTAIKPPAYQAYSSPGWMAKPAAGW
jgi:hypothetical protein